MSILSDITTAVGEIRTMAGNITGARDRYFEKPVDSLARKAKQSILFFPLVTSESISSETASTLAKATQVRCAEYVRLMIANMDALPDTGSGTGPKEKLISAIRGMDLASAIKDEACSAVSALVARKADILAEEALRPGGIFPAIERHLLAEGGGTKRKEREAAKTAADGESVDSGLKKPVDHDYMDAKTDSSSEGEETSPESLSNKGKTGKKSDFSSSPVDVNTLAHGDANERLQAAKIIADRMAKGDTAFLHALSGKGVELRDLVAKLPQDGYKLWSNTVGPAKQIDMDKINRIMPVLLDLEVQVLYGTNGTVTTPATTKLMLGIKAPLHQVPSLDLVTGLGTSLQRDSFLLQFFRMASGEISFVKDFVLNLGHIKARTSGKQSTGTRALEGLRKQAEWNAARQSIFVKHVTEKGFTPPTATIAVTADEVAQIKSLYNVDFGSVGVVRQFMSAHNLMGFMIVDEVIGLVRVYEDGSDTGFDRVPMTELVRQGKETSVKDVLKIMASR
jgi:hypothetical protein